MKALELAEELAAMLAVLPESERLPLLNEVRARLHAVSPQRGGPVDFVRWVPMEKVEGNDYNPNSVARIEMGLLLKSIDHDGYTQPIVVVYDADRDMYVVVDGFHRSAIMRASSEIARRYHGCLPVVVIDKPINDRMASTVRHNRARGRHSVSGMAHMVFQMLDNGMDDAAVCNELGLEAEELVRLKHITGFSKLFKDTKYNRAWTTKNQVRLREQRKQVDAAQGYSPMALANIKPGDEPSHG